MDFLIPFLLCLFAFNTSPTWAWATHVESSDFKGLICNQYQQWCENTDLVTVESRLMRVGKAGPRGPIGRPGDVGPPGRVGPTGPQAVINMTLIEQSIDEKIKEALRMFPRRSCDGAKLEYALERNDSGGGFDLYIPTIGFRNVFCDVTDDGGNWTRRMNGDVDFNRRWDDYVKGFGDLQGDLWLGLEALHQMTNAGNIELKINMITKDGGGYSFAKYSNFRIGPSSDNYRLTVSGYSGNATGDGLAHHNNRQFTTKDADNDDASYNCASSRNGGYWYGSCTTSNLNGNFNKTNNAGIWWKEYSNLLRYSEMKFRRRSSKEK